MGWSDFPAMIDAVVKIDQLLKSAIRNEKASLEEQEIAELLRSAGRGKGGVWVDLELEHSARLEGRDDFPSVFQDESFRREIKRILDHLKSIRERCAEGKSGRIGQNYAIHLHQCILAWEMIYKIKGREISTNNLKYVIDFVEKMIVTGDENAKNFQELGNT